MATGKKERHVMMKRKTVFEQVPVEIARKVATEELKQKEASLKNSRSKQKAGRSPMEAEIVARTGASL